MLKYDKLSESKFRLQFTDLTIMYDELHEIDVAFLTLNKCNKMKDDKIFILLYTNHCFILHQREMHLDGEEKYNQNLTTLHFQ